MKNKFSTIKQVGFVFDLLKEHKIHSVEEFRKIIDGKSSLDGSATFTILRDADVPLDSESRWYDDEFEFRQTIFDCEEVWLRNSSKINLHDCIFLGSLFVSNGNDSVATEVYMDSCIVGRTLQIRVGENDMSSVGLTDVSSGELRVMQSHVSELGIIGGAFGRAALEHLKGAQLTVMGSSLRELQFSDCNFNRVVFPRGQVTVRERPRKNFLERLVTRRRKFCSFDTTWKSKYSDSYWNQRSTQERTRQLIETYDFFLNQTEIRHSKLDASHVKYLRAMAESHSCASRWFVFATGAFLKPSRMLLLSAVILSAFAAIYMLPCCKFVIAGPTPSVHGPLSMLDAIYFSCVTFTTLGYGDIVPVDGARAIAMIEALLGIVMSSSLAVSIARRYIE
ncbi:potassium channel family protein [Burkholderia pyrrocinia]